MPIPSETARRALESILARERRWAARHGHALDVAGDHLVDAADALCFALASAHRERLDRHPDRPLGETDKRAPVSRLGSAWGVACNLIEAIPTEALDGLLEALGASGRAVRRGWVHSSERLDGGTAAPPLVRIDREGDRPVFVEMLGVELASGEHATGPALPQADAGWGDLEGCRQLATEAARSGDPVPLGRLLRRIRTLCRSHGRRGFRYVVVRSHFDARFDDLLRRAFDGLRIRIGGEVDFDALDLATVHARLAGAGEAAHPALGWLADRYLDEATV